MGSGGEFAPWLAPSHETLAEELTRRFYAWERRGRGWQLWPYPVSIEPPFKPFFGHFIAQTPFADDGRKPTLFSSLADRARAFFKPSTPQTQLVEAPQDFLDREPEPDFFWDESEIVEIRISLPQQIAVNAEVAERFLLSLSLCSHPLSFEVVGLPNSILVQIACRASDADQAKGQLRAHFPDVSLQTTDGFLRQRWHTNLPRVIVDFGLSNEFMRPLHRLSRLDPDPLMGMAGALTSVEAGELAICQVLFEAVRSPWTDHILFAVSDNDGRCFFEDAPEMLALAREKVTHPLFAGVLRVAAQSPVPSRMQELVRAVSSTLAALNDPRSNQLIALSNQGYEYDLHEEDLLLRRTHRNGMILNAAELASLVHPPSASVRAEKLARETRKTKAAPTSVTGHALVLGENIHQGKRTQVSVSREDRLRHAHIVGATGTGKSTLLINLIMQDIAQGNGVAVIDPHGDLVDEILGRIPRSRWSDVALFDAADADYPVGFNVISAHSDVEKTILTSDLGTVFRRFATSWGDQMSSLLGNAISAFIESDQGGTLLDLRRFLIERDYREDVLKHVSDPHVRYWWNHEFPMLRGTPQASILTRLDTFLRPKLVRNIVAQKQSKLRFDAILNSGKILLVKLAQGLIGEENGHFLGAFLVSKLHQVVMSRQELPDAARKDFFLYIDEFQHFVTPSLASILSGARKYHLGLTLAHQDLRQLWSRDPEVASAVIANPSIRVCFRLGEFDAQKLKGGFASFDSADLQTLSIGEAIARVGRADHDFNLHTPPLSPITEQVTAETRTKLIGLSRAAYGTPRADVEAAQEAMHAPSEVSAAPQKTQPPRQMPRREVATVLPAKPKPPIPDGVLASEPEAASGRGGAQHRYLQQLIRRFAEDKGWRVTIEKPVLKGLGSVDVAIESEELSIACEISATSTTGQEFGNVQKCLSAGFNHVIAVSAEKRNLAKLRQFVTERLDEKDKSRVQFLLPEELFSFIEGFDAQGSKESTVRGYKVKVRYRPDGAGEMKARSQVIAQTIGQALHRLRSRS